MYIYTFVYACTLSICLSNLAIDLPIYRPTYPSIYLSACLSIYPKGTPKPAFPRQTWTEQSFGGRPPEKATGSGLGFRA